MPEPIVIVDVSEVLEGKLEPLKTAMNELVAFVEANEPRMIAYDVYLGEDGTLLTVFQIHPDSGSAEFHMQVSGSAFPQFAGLIRMSRIDIYGRPSPGLLERLRRKGRMLGTDTVIVHDLHAGFARFRCVSPEAR